MSQQPTDPQDIENLVRYHAKRHGVDPDIAASLARTESSFNPAAKNASTGASGVMQLMPSTAKSLGVNNIMDANENTEAGVRYFKQLLDKNKGDTRAALTEYGGFKTTDPTDYINKVLGTPSPAAGGQGKLFDPKEFAAPAKPIDYGQAALAGNLDPSGFQSKLQEAGQAGLAAGRAAQPYAPYAIAGVAGLVNPLLAPPAMLLARGLQQTALVQQGKQTKEGAIRNTLEDAITEGEGQLAAKGLELVAPGLAKWVYRKTMGVDPDSAKQAEAIGDMVARHIPGGPGRKMTMRSLKSVENTGLNDVITRNAGETLNKTNLFGDIAQHYISTDQTAPMNEVRAALGPKGAAIVEKIRNGIPLRAEKYLPNGKRVASELEDAVEDTASSGAFSNFIGRQKNDISLTDARKLKQNLQSAVPYNEVTEGMMQGRKVVAGHLADNMRRAIPDAADQAKFTKHSRELEKLINIEDLPGFGKVSKLPGMETTVPLAGAAIGQSSGYYSHTSPMAASARGFLGRTLTGVPNVGVHLLNSPWFRQAAIGAGGAATQNDQPTMNLSPEELKKILKSFDERQQ